MKKILLKNGNIVNERNSIKIADLLIANNLIEQIDPDIAVEDGWQVIDLGGKLIIPGLIDMQVHLREPGAENKETIETGLKAAVKGGFTTVAAMPNTDPVLDNVEQISYLRNKVASLDLCGVIAVPSMTKQMMQKKIADYQAYADAGVIAITDDGRGIADDSLMKKIFIEAAKFKLSVLQHCEFLKLSDSGAFHEGPRAQELNVRGIPSESEYKMIARDIDLLREHGGHYHVLHLSTKEGVDLVAQAKAEGLNITAEVTPHHLVLCDQDILEVDANYKMNPPLRSQDDRDALVQAVASGIIDLISTDHAPHTLEDKGKEIHQAPFGIVGLETAFALLYTELVLKDKITLWRLVELMSLRACEIFKLEGGKIKVGEVANLAVIDIEKAHMVEPEAFVSKGRNTPFGGRKLKGWPVRTFFKGEQVWKSE